MKPWITAGLVLFSVLSTSAAAQTAPEARAHFQLVHHAGEDRTYLIGGSTSRPSGFHYFDDTWSWDGTRWARADALPFPRSGHRVVYHPQRNSLILFGGGFAQALRTEGVIWERAAGGAWRAIGGNFRAATTEAEMCYDRRRDRLVIFGGWDAANAYRGDTWEWQPTGLVRVDSSGPSPRAGHAFAYDPVRQRCLVFGGRNGGGFLADTWEWDGSAWREIAVTGPSPRWFSGAATDFERGRIVIFGGRGPAAPVIGRDATGDLGDTWAWNGERWEEIPGTAPPPRSGGQLAFTGRGVLLFGGREERPESFRDRADLWELRGRTWTQVQ